MIETEYEVAKAMYEKQSLGNNPLLDGRLLVKFCKTIGMSKTDTHSMIDKLVSEKTNLLSKKMSDGIVEIITSDFDMVMPFDFTPIYFYPEEMSVILECDNMVEQKMLFCMLYIKKRTGKDRFEASKADINRLFINPINANTYYNHEFKLKENGYVRYGMFHGKMYTEFTDERLLREYSSEPVITITNRNNIIYYFYNYINYGKYVFCKNCGTIEVAKGHGQKYCAACAKAMRNKSRQK